MDAFFDEGFAMLVMSRDDIHTKMAPKLEAARDKCENEHSAQYFLAGFNHFIIRKYIF